MASESVTTYAIEADDVKRIQWMLLDGIKAKAALEQLKNNIEFCAKHDHPAKDLLAAQPDPVDLEFMKAAEMIQILSVLPAGKEV